MSGRDRDLVLECRTGEKGDDVILPNINNPDHREMVIGGSDTDTDLVEVEEVGGENSGSGAGDGLQGQEEESPLTNDLILSKIMSYLSLSDLKNSRLVCKKWNGEASASISKTFEKTLQVSFNFRVEYLSQEFSTRVSRYIDEMKGLKIRNLCISLNKALNQDGGTSLVQDPPGESGPWTKMFDDLQNLLNSAHNFSRLSLDCVVKTEADFVLFSFIFQELAGKLEKLKLVGYLQYLPDDLPPFPVSNLKKINQKRWSVYDELEQKWLSLLPIFTPRLEYFSCHSHNGELYLQGFLQHEKEMTQLKGIGFGPWNYGIPAEGLSLLLQVSKPLTSLKLDYIQPDPAGSTMLENLLFKHSKSLKRLVLAIVPHWDYANTNPEVKFPPFPKLEVLELDYDGRTRINWGTSFNYQEHLPSLKKLVIEPPIWYVVSGLLGNDTVFQSFFPQEGEVTCETLEELGVAVFPKPGGMGYSPNQEENFQPRMDRIRELFPNCVNMNFVKTARVAY